MRPHCPPDFYSLPRIQHSATANRIPVARSVGYDDDARRLAQRLHRSFGSSVDMNPRSLGLLLLVIGAGSVELSIAQYNTALGENGPLQFCDRPSGGPISQWPGHALSQDLRRPAPPRGFDKILGSLGSDASVQICVFTDLRRIIRQIGQLVQHDVRCEVTNCLDYSLPVEDITQHRFGTEVAQ
ncbi:hypothetical protein AXA44_35090 [Rhodococcus sp. SC4]|nr:hypothetical protein AXA44_35090 [Rhodococcus sp. SC4]